MCLVADPKPPSGQAEYLILQQEAEEYSDPRDFTLNDLQTHQELSSRLNIYSV